MCVYAHFFTLAMNLSAKVTNLQKDVWAVAYR